MRKGQKFSLGMTCKSPHGLVIFWDALVSTVYEYKSGTLDHCSELQRCSGLLAVIKSRVWIHFAGNFFVGHPLVGKNSWLNHYYTYGDVCKYAITMHNFLLSKCVACFRGTSLCYLHYACVLYILTNSQSTSMFAIHWTMMRYKCMYNIQRIPVTLGVNAEEKMQWPLRGCNFFCLALNHIPHPCTFSLSSGDFMLSHSCTQLYKCRLCWGPDAAQAT